MTKKLLTTCAAICSMLAPVLSVSAAPTSTSASLPAGLTDGRLIQASSPTVYWYTGDRRYVFPNEETFYTWFSPYDFTRIVHISDADMMAIRVGGNITYRPGSRLLKLATDARVYAVDNRGTLRPIEGEAVAAELYGENWAQFVDNIPDAFFVNYRLGSAIRRASDFNPTNDLTPTAATR